jgi:hypothetical protein
MTLIALGSYASLNFERIQHVDPTPATITVAGTGEVNAVPDIGQFTFSVEEKRDTASEAQSASAESVNEILSYLEEAGVAEEDVETTNYNLYPNWRYEERVCELGVSYCPPGERVQDGFTVTQTVSVKVRDTEQAGELIAGVGERGATNISGLQFTIDDPSALQAEARSQAIADAQAKATQLSADLGVRITGLAGFHEQSGPTPYFGRSFMETADMEGRGGATPQLPTGEDTTTVQVSLTYEVR